MQDKSINDICKEYGRTLDEKQLAYAIELLASIHNKDFVDYKWLNSAEKYHEHIEQAEVLIKLLFVVSDISNINESRSLDDKHVNSIVSQLANINSLSRHPRARAMCQYFIELLATINDADFEGFEWLRAEVKSYPEPMGSVAIIDELINVFEKLVDINAVQEGEQVSIYGVITRLINLNSLSRSFDDKTKSSLKYNFFRLRNEYLNPDYISSPGFSQEGEDLVLKRLFPPDKKGFFVDVGAHHPTRFSNTFLLYKQGWRGINIDPLRGGMELFRTIRPLDINLEVAVGNGKSGMDYASYIQFEEPAYNCLFFEEKEQVVNKIESKIVEIHKIPVRSLNAIFEEYSSEFDHIDLLSIDVEGLEEEVFDGFSIDKYLPDVIVVEIRGFSLEKREKFPVYSLLKESGYELRSMLFHSLIFTRREM